jgi:hypothetical protein
VACDSTKVGLAIFSFNRPQHLKILYETIHDFKLENQYCFHLFNDGPKTSKTPEIKLVHELTDKFAGLVKNFEVSRRIENFGLAKSIRSGLDLVFAIHGKAIILEDDIIPSKAFFEVIEFFLSNQEFNSSVGSITGANTTTFPFLEKRDFLMSKRHSSWGWATWADRWLSIDWKYIDHEFLEDKPVISKVRRVSPDLVGYAELQAAGKIDSWATGMNIDFIKRELLCIVPKKDLITNIGLDGSGTHEAKSMLKNQMRSLIKEPELNFEKYSKLEQSEYYNFLVRKDNSLMRNFPIGNILRLLGKVKSFSKDRIRLNL